MAWIPTLYMAEGLPYVLALTVSTIMYTRLGVSLQEIGLWTSILGYAWVVKPLWGPLVDMYWTKRRWTVLMQILMGVALGGLALTLQAPWWWTGSLLILGVVALFSATHDIAADGFYMDALDEKQQSFYVGIRSTFYRISMIFGQGILLIIAGLIEQRTGPSPSEFVVQASPPGIVASAPAAPHTDGFLVFEPAVASVAPGGQTTVSVTLKEQPTDERIVNLNRSNSGLLTTFFPFGAEYNVSLADKKNETLRFTPENWNVPQQVAIGADKNLRESVNVSFKGSSGNIPLTWALCFGGVGVLLTLFGVYHLLVLPRAVETRKDDAGERAPFWLAAGVMALLVAIPVGVFMGMYYGLSQLMAASYLAGATGQAGLSAETSKFIKIGLIIFIIWGAFLVPAVRQAFKDAFSSAARVSRVPFDEVFASFFARPGIARMVTFLLVYRLGEALLLKMSGPFLVKPVAEGGLGLSSAQYGLAYGTFGIVALTVGGILGGIVASRWGLKKWLFIMCLAINLPDAFYIYLAYYQPPEFWKVLLCVAGESFGYGFGFTAYMLYMLYIAGSGEHKTSHFALCTGFMALGVMLPGMISGDIANALVTSHPEAPNMGWVWYFVIVCIATIPGFLMLKKIPLDAEFGIRKQ